MINLINILASGTAGNENTANNWWVYLVLIGLVIVMLVFPMFTQKKRNKEFNSMLESMKVGDKIRTIGGIIGRVVKINKDSDIPTVVIETGNKGDKCTMEFDVTAIQYNFNYNPQAAAIAKESKKEEKKADKVEEKVEAKEEATTPEEKVEAVEEKKEVKEEKKAPAKKSAAKKSSTKKTTKK